MDTSSGKTKLKMFIDNPKSVRSWIKFRESIGHPTFSLQDLREAMPRYKNAVLNTELHRLTAAGVIMPVYHGFYVTIPTHYLRSGVVPPMFYIDDLAAYMKRPYYMSLLSAAMIHGASHQKPQVDFATTVPPRMSLSSVKNPYLRWVYRPSINPNFILTRNSEGGVVRYSSAEYTAFDLVQYAHHCGGLSEVSTVLAELVEAMDAARITPDLLAEFKGTTVQRLGYVLEDVLGETAFANKLYETFVHSGGRQLPILLNQNLKVRSEKKNARWKIEINTEVEPDEL